jgi:hypothetical protein
MADHCSFCGSTAGPFSNVEGFFTVLMCADCRATRGYGSGPYPVMTRAEMRAGLTCCRAGRLSRRRPPTARSSRPCASGWLPASRWLACTKAGAGLAGAASPGGRRAGSSTEANNGEPPTIMTPWVGRLEL